MSREEVDPLYDRIKLEIERVVRAGYGEVSIVVSNGGSVIDVIGAPRERFRLLSDTYEYEQRLPENK